jgi:two-component system, NarL family, response regulator DegU
MKKINVFIADDHPLFRKGLRDTIEPVPEFNLVGEAEDGETALRLVGELVPDVVVLDIEMPKMTGLETASRLHDGGNPAGVVILTMYKDPDFLYQALDLGVRGYVLKDCAVRDIVESIRTVAAGSYYLSPVLSTHLIARDERLRAFHAAHRGVVLLTPSERKILKLVAENLTSREIAARLNISEKTVENHRANIADKLDIHGAHQLLKFALENKSCL